MSRPLEPAARSNEVAEAVPGVAVASEACPTALPVGNQVVGVMVAWAVGSAA